MTNTVLTLESVSFILPDGKTLFSQLNAQFDARHTGMVGRNGVGKSCLAKILAGLIVPGSGKCTSTGKVKYLSQHVPTQAGHNIAMLAGVDAPLAALRRIEAGSSCQTDFDLVGNDWDMGHRLQVQLESAGLGYLSADTPADRLSGGEAMRVALSGAILSDPDYLILDEPTNHLDAASRHMLLQQLQHWPRGLLVISHDRTLLQQMERIVELSSLGLHSYGGNYTVYQQLKAQQTASATQQLDRLKVERKRKQRALSDKRERLEKRQSRANSQSKDANQAKILLGRQKGRSEASAGKREKQDAQTQTQLSLQVQSAAQKIETAPQIVMHTISPATTLSHRVVTLTDVILPFAASPFNRVNLTITGGQRIGVTGPNGCGKSTLLKLLAGELAEVSGQSDIWVKTAYLDQQLSLLDRQKNVLDQLRAVNTQAGESQLRMQLAQLGLDATKIALPCGLLSGGEQLKAALAICIYAEPAAQFLLLDEPSNHLDFASLDALESLLRQYSGTLMVVSHDALLLRQIGLTHRLTAAESGWELKAI